jgi:hypothetical protein
MSIILDLTVGFGLETFRLVMTVSAETTSDDSMTQILQHLNETYCETV